MPDRASRSVLTIPATFSISGRKLTDYLLNLQHPIGGSKARFFIGHGFSPDRPDELAQALLSHSTATAVEKQTRHGLRLVITAPLMTPNETRPLLVSVWQIEPRTAVANFITAYPA